MNTLTRHATALLALLMFGAAGCGSDGAGDKAESGLQVEDRRAIVVSEFERAVEEARYLREDIAAVRADMRTVREAAQDEVERTSKDAAVLRSEIAALRLEMREMSDAAAAEAARTAEEAKSLREEISAIRAEMSALRETAEQAETLSPEEIAGTRTELDSYPDPVSIDDEVRSNRRSSLRRTQGPTTVIYAPPYERRRVYMSQPYRSRTGARRPRQSVDAGPHRPQVQDLQPSSPSAPSVSGPRPSAPNVRPVAPAARPAAPASRRAAPAPRPAPRPANVEYKKVHVPKPQR